ncbi:UDP-N-acetylmuramoyl-L-alanine--D-glutamate ligase [Variovorax sp. OV329]|uniref:UDP-N-acetylmuramoyl-L-alanine--D-glutamate ligase n=1 Tax=Variovorax sp. OV329 TaxID=1882825 RepID=UPI0008E9224C|nr:UDP-N-acetylmuramoyl-L-alanine--D-glutamate ligase [Variovorax sp. OV329]SFM15054.1 UDP-N-acetylmuramoylalanine--D-glutamate ligase [Variovorax sp. OV329]
MKHLDQLHVLILGLGASGLAMARWCVRHGAVVTVADTREAPPQLATLKSELPSATFVGGPFSAALVEGTAIRAVYCSPGLSPQVMAPVVSVARSIGLPVGGELDLFAQALADLAVPPVVETAEDEATEGEASEAATPDADTVTAPEDQASERQAAPAEAAVEAGTDAVARTEIEAEAEAEAEATESPLEDEQPAPPASDESVAPADEEGDAPVPVVEPPKPRGYEPAVLAITGTNGKTTVTSLTGQLVERAGKRVAVAGNIGPTLLDTLAARMDAQDLPEVWVLELSSFQLDGVQGFEPTAAVVLNVTQDHLDWHGDMDAYAKAKARIFGKKGLMVLNRDDAIVMAMLPPPVKVKLQRPQIRAHITFGADLPRRPGDFGIERVNGMAWLVRAHEADETIKRKRGAVVEEEIHLQRLMPADALRIRGQHNALNALAALALAVSAGCSLAPMLYGLREYSGEPHRVEPVAIIDEVEYFDDSKGTNVGATVAALTGLGVDRRVVLILGGEGKGQDFSPLAEPVSRHARAVILIGRDAPIIEEALAGTGVSLQHAASMEEAVNAASRRANPGDAVLLSPACASFDMFKDYAHRAAVFCEAVQVLVDSPRTAGLDDDEGAPA